MLEIIINDKMCVGRTLDDTKEPTIGKRENNSFQAVFSLNKGVFGQISLVKWLHYTVIHCFAA